GPTTFGAAADRFLCTDLVVHGWDVARTAGLDERMDPADVTRVRRYMEEMGDALRGPQAFGPAIEPPAGADEQAQLLAFLGRQP
ncbi:MAG: TIGR03086 family protein, partial [Actinobacteria bacterium]|nr:TIGR03086 family protein [Actinomycetota bacterium]